MYELFAVLKISAFWDVTPCSLIGTNVLEARGASIDKILLEPDDGGGAFLRNGASCLSNNSVPSWRRTYCVSNLQYLAVDALEGNNSCSANRSKHVTRTVSEQMQRFVILNTNH